MHVLIVFKQKIPVIKYGGTERVVWSLGKSLVRKGHKVTYLVKSGSTCDFAEVLTYQPTVSLAQQIPSDVDVIHLHFQPKEALPKPFIVTEHSVDEKKTVLDRNTVFLSKQHASLYGANAFVYNGLDWSDYPTVDWDMPRKHYHFLGKGALKYKNLKGAIKVAQMANHRMDVLGANRFLFSLNANRGVRFTFDPMIHFHGMVGGLQKFQLLNQSKGLIFPVRWHEPFGLAIIESLYFGCPVFATPYGAIPEIVTAEVGCLSNQSELLVEAMLQKSFDQRLCHEVAVKKFNADVMTDKYLMMYEKVISGEPIQQTEPCCVQGMEMLSWN